MVDFSQQLFLLCVQTILFILYKFNSLQAFKNNTHIYIGFTLSSHQGGTRIVKIAWGQDFFLAKGALPP